MNNIKLSGYLAGYMHKQAAADIQTMAQTALNMPDGGKEFLDRINATDPELFGELILEMDRLEGQQAPTPEEIAEASKGWSAEDKAILDRVQAVAGMPKAAYDTSVKVGGKVIGPGGPTERQKYILNIKAQMAGQAEPYPGVKAPVEPTAPEVPKTPPTAPAKPMPQPTTAHGKPVEEKYTSSDF